MATFRGTWTAIATPMMSGNIDEAALRKLVDYQIACGVAGVVACGTTGESATLNTEERLRVTKLCVEFANKRIPVVAGTGTSSTAETVAFTREASKLGVMGCMVVTPAYNKPTQEGLFQHFREAAKATQLPIVLYNVPGRTACNMLPETVARIADACPNVAAIKEASGNPVQSSNCKRLAPRLDLLSGDDGLTLPLLAVGATGVVSVLSNVAPKQVREVIDRYEAGDREGARLAHEKLLPLLDAMFAESNPIPVKYALKRIGIGDGGARLPLVPASDKLAQRIDGILKELGLL